jgi:hypothetical protein
MSMRPTLVDDEFTAHGWQHRSPATRSTSDAETHTLHAAWDE